MAYRIKNPLRENLQGGSHTIANVVRVVRTVRKGSIGVLSGRPITVIQRSMDIRANKERGTGEWWWRLP